MKHFSLPLPVSSLLPWINLKQLSHSPFLMTSMSMFWPLLLYKSIWMAHSLILLTWVATAFKVLFANWNPGSLSGVLESFTCMVTPHMCLVTRPSFHPQYRLHINPLLPQHSGSVLPCLPWSWIQCFSWISDQFVSGGKVCSHFFYKCIHKIWTICRHKVTKFLCGDGNYPLGHKKNGKFDPDDVALADGNAYFSDMELFKAYLEVVGDSDEVRVVLMWWFITMTLLWQKSTCNHLNAALMQNITKFKNNDVSGIFAILCAHHRFFEAQGMVDLQKGKWWVP